MKTQPGNDMLGRTMRWLCGFVLLFLPLWLSAETLSLSAEEWSRPRSGEQLARHEGLSRLVRALEAGTSQTRLRIRFGVREEDLLWAEELRDWLVALGLPSARIVLERDASVQGELVVQTQTRPNGGGAGI